MKAIPASRYALFFSMATIGCVADLALKSWVFAWLGPPGPESRVVWFWPRFVGLQTSLNEGALFGIGAGKMPLLIALSIAAALVIVYCLFVAGAARDLMLTVALASITAGIFGNLYDRLGWHGLVWQWAPRAGEPVYAVRDFVLLQASDQLRWPNFNLADSMLVCGAAMLFWHSLRSAPSTAPDADDS